MGFGLELSRAFFERVKPSLEVLLPAAAFGLVGEGSECLGFDDEISRDHDFGAAFCIWLPDEELDQWRGTTEAVLDGLPQVFCGRPTRFSPEAAKTEAGAERVGLLGIQSFYYKFTGLGRPPADWGEWLGIPEHFLAVCTGGEVFHDARGLFTAHRQALLDFYPEDVRRKKLAARCLEMAQSGQYNLGRCLRRSEGVAAMQCAARFAGAALSAAYLLNRRYMPFYKWAHHGLGQLPRLGGTTQGVLTLLAGLSFGRGPEILEAAFEAVEDLCAAVIRELHEQGLSQLSSPHLIEQAQEIQNNIHTPEIRAMHLMAG